MGIGKSPPPALHYSEMRTRGMGRREKKRGRAIPQKKSRSDFFEDQRDRVFFA
jgi:hypothetical protein